MFFNSIDFALFLPIVFSVYWLSHKNITIQNIVVVIASYIFYGWWDWHFLLLILFSTITDYLVGIGLSKQENKQIRKILLGISIGINLLFLGYFKYYNFFTDNFVSAFSFLGMKLNMHHLNIVLPVGISFYTFQTMSYSIDVYNKKLYPTKDFIAFTAFVSFFPQLVAGPIERASSLLPQFYKKRIFKYEKAIDGCKQILWGFFKKIIVADNCAVYVDAVFENYNAYSGSTLLLAAVFFAFQIYGDFSGYSDIAIGTSKLFGFKLMKNFSYPYFSRDIAEFWRRWHISLTTWFRDYVYIPLGGNRRNILTSIRNTFIIFLLSGFWHGANWRFLFWGLVNAIFFLPLLILKKNRINVETVALKKSLPSIKELLSMVITFCLSVFAWIFFRSESLSGAFNYIARMYPTTIKLIELDIVGKFIILSILLSIPILIIIEWINRNEEYGFKRQPKNIIIRRSLYVMITLIIIELGGGQHGFIYFQF